ncbi:MAG: alpha/beta hydrolase [Rhodanobacter sp.]
MPKSTESTIRLPQRSLRAQRWGDDSLPPVLAVHGWLDNAGSFARVAPLLAARHHVIALELPGHGHSDHLGAGSSYHFLDYVRDVLAVADVLQLARYTLFGHSLGAGIASMVAAANPERIARLFLIEGLGPLGDDGSRTLERFREALTPRSGNGKRLRVFASIEQATQARNMVSGLAKELARPIVERGLVETQGGWSWRSDPALTRPSATRLAESQVHALLRGITTSTSLLLAQPATSYLPGCLMRARADCVPQISVKHMDGGHHLHLEHPQAVADWINASPPSP